MFKMSLKLLKYMYIRCLCYMFQLRRAIFRRHILQMSLLHCALGLIVFIKAYPCGGGVEYLHRNPASRKRRDEMGLKKRLRHSLSG
jgi:hypothetical protein